MFVSSTRHFRKQAGWRRFEMDDKQLAPKPSALFANKCLHLRRARQTSDFHVLEETSPPRRVRQDDSLKAINRLIGQTAGSYLSGKRTQSADA